MHTLYIYGSCIKYSNIFYSCCNSWLVVERVYGPCQTNTWHGTAKTVITWCIRTAIKLSIHTYKHTLWMCECSHVQTVYHYIDQCKDNTHLRHELCWNSLFLILNYTYIPIYCIWWWCVHLARIRCARTLCTGYNDNIYIYIGPEWRHSMTYILYISVKTHQWKLQTNWISLIHTYFLVSRRTLALLMASSSWHTLLMVCLCVWPNRP